MQLDMPIALRTGRGRIPCDEGIDLPAGEHLATMPVAATIVPVAWPQRRLKAHMLAPARSTDPVLQGDAYLAMLNDMPPAPGTSMVAYVARAEARPAPYQLASLPDLRQAE